LNTWVNYLGVVILIHVSTYFVSDALKVFCRPRPDISVYLSVLLFGRIPTLTARTCYINERVFVSGHINEHDHSGAIHTVKVACGILLDTVTGTVTQRVCTDTAMPHL